MKKPSKKIIRKLSACRLLVMDFDGVLTDNKVYTTSDGKELVRCDRSDSLGLEMLQKLTPVKILIISKEKNPVVKARAQKLRIPVLHHIDDKLPRLKKEVKKLGLKMSQVCYVGNDINDIECLQNVGLAIAVKNAYPEVKAVSDHLTENTGGDGAVREICELLIENFKK